MTIKKVAVMCGEKWYSFASWKAYPLIWLCRKSTKKRGSIGFGIGPILFWDGS